MGEEAFEEVEVLAQDGSVVLRRRYGDETILLGVGRTHEPELLVELGPDDVDELVQALGDMRRHARAR